MNTALSLMVLTLIALVAGAIFLLRRGAKRQALLMLVLAAVIAMNVAIWAVPGPDGRSPLTSRPE